MVPGNIRMMDAHLIGWLHVYKENHLGIIVIGYVSCSRGQVLVITRKGSFFLTLVLMIISERTE
jgi:homospermidine synthase